MIGNCISAEEELVFAAGECPVLSHALRSHVFGAVAAAKHRRIVRRRVAATACLLISVAGSFLWQRAPSFHWPQHRLGVTAAAGLMPHKVLLRPALAAESDNSAADWIAVHVMSEWDFFDDLRMQLLTREERFRMFHRAF